MPLIPGRLMSMSTRPGSSASASSTASSPLSASPTTSNPGVAVTTMWAARAPGRLGESRLGAEGLDQPGVGRVLPLVGLVAHEEVEFGVAVLGARPHEVLEQEPAGRVRATSSVVGGYPRREPPVLSEPD